MNGAVINLSPELVEFVRTTALNLKEQDNRMTSFPIFVVESANITFQVDPDISREGDMIESPTDGWFHGESNIPETNEAVIKFLDAEEHCGRWQDHDVPRPEGLDEDLKGWRKFDYAYRWKREEAFLTEKAAQGFIKTNRHNLPGDGGHVPRVYVESGYRNKEHQMLLELIRALAPQL